jgi:hypothetical protein
MSYLPGREQELVYLGFPFPLTLRNLHFPVRGFMWKLNEKPEDEEVP